MDTTPGSSRAMATGLSFRQPRRFGRSFSGPLVDRFGWGAEVSISGTVVARRAAGNGGVFAARRPAFVRGSRWTRARWCLVDPQPHVFVFGGVLERRPPLTAHARVFPARGVKAGGARLRACNLHDTLDSPLCGHSGNPPNPERDARSNRQDAAGKVRIHPRLRRRGRRRSINLMRAPRPYSFVALALAVLMAALNMPVGIMLGLRASESRPKNLRPPPRIVRQVGRKPESGHTD